MRVRRSEVTLDAESGVVLDRAPMRPLRTYVYSADPNVRRVQRGDVRYTSMPSMDIEHKVHITARRTGDDMVLWERTVEGAPADLDATDDVVIASWAPVTSEFDVAVNVVALHAATGATRWSTVVNTTGPWPDKRLGQHQEMFRPVPEGTIRRRGSSLD